MNPIIIDGFKLMVLGMGMVFVFLVIMVALVQLNQKLLTPFKAIFEPKVAPAKDKRAKKESDLLNDKELVSVISSAINEFKNKK